MLMTEDSLFTSEHAIAVTIINMENVALNLDIA